MFVASSGRQYDNEVNLFKPVKDQISYIAENGSICIHKGNVIFRTVIAPELIRRTIDEVKKDGPHIIDKYLHHLKAKETGDALLAEEAVKRLAESYKNMFRLDNARSILLDLAKEYLQNGKLAEVTDAQFGEGCSEYAARAIREYYGV